MSKLLAIVPAYNEAGAIADTVAEIHRQAPGFAVVVAVTELALGAALALAARSLRSNGPQPEA